jgi:hypothetical protein
MKSRIVTTTVVLLSLVLFFAVATPNVWAGEHKHCSLSAVAGDYGYTANGFVATPTGSFVPVAAAGRISFDRHGNVTGVQTRVLAGSALDETYSGTYTVNTDCTGSFTVLIQPDTRTSTVNVVWVDNANAADAVFTNPGFVLTANATRITKNEN